jgi:small-conductance mechanosensitive channel
MNPHPSLPDPPFQDQLSALWSGTWAWVSLHFNQIIFSVIICAGIIALLQAGKLFGIWLCRPGRRKGSWPHIIGKALARTRLWFMAGVAAEVFALLGQAPVTVAQPVHMVFVVTAFLQAAIWVRTLILGTVERRAVDDDEHGNLQSAVGLIRVLVTAGLFIIAAILILANLGVNVTGLLAGLGIGGIAIGLAAQGIFSDLFAALSILFDKPFRKGDLIRFDQTTGTVEYIGLKSSRIRALSGEEIIVSNANLLAKELRNFARVERRRVNMTLSLVYATPPALLEEMPLILQPVIDACQGAAFQRVGVNSFAPSSLDLSLVYDIDASDQADILARKNDVNIAVLKAFAQRGIAFAYPTQTTYTAAPDGTLVMPYASPPTAPAKPRKG